MVCDLAAAIATVTVEENEHDTTVILDLSECIQEQT